MCEHSLVVMLYVHHEVVLMYKHFDSYDAVISEQFDSFEVLS